MRNKLALVVAVVLGLIAVYGVSRIIKKNEDTYVKSNPKVRVAAAGKRITAGTIVEPEMILVEKSKGSDKSLPGIEISESAVQPGQVMVRDEDNLVGMKINTTVERGQQLFWSYFRQPVEKLDKKLVPGERAITLRVDSITGVADNLTPNARVDIIGTFPLGQAATGGKGAAASGAAASHTLLMLSNVTILALDSRTHEDEYVSSSSAARGRGYSSVTLEVTQEEANLLVYAQQFGTLTLSLRPPADSKPVIGPTEITDKNILDVAAKAQEERQKRLKDESPMQPVRKE